MVIRRGEVWWASLPDPVGSGPGYRRPVLVIQAHEFNQSAIRTIVCAVITSNMRLANAPGNVRLSRKASSLAKDSVINVSQLITVDKRLLTARIGRLPPEALRDVDGGIRLVLAV